MTEIFTGAKLLFGVLRDYLVNKITFIPLLSQ